MVTVYVTWLHVLVSLSAQLPGQQQLLRVPSPALEQDMFSKYCGYLQRG